MRRAAGTFGAFVLVVIGGVVFARPAGEAQPAPSLERLVVAEPSHEAAYAGKREALFGGWKDLDRDGCDTREEVLQRDLQDETLGKGCRVLAGQFVDPYTGVGGQADASRLDIDHVVSLGDAWRSGAWAWSQDRRVAFANDEANLVATNLTQNRRKSDQGPADWQPPNPAHHCRFAQTIVEVKGRYQLTITAPDRAALEHLLAAC